MSNRVFAILIGIPATVVILVGQGVGFDLIRAFLIGLSMGGITHTLVDVLRSKNE